MIIALDSRSSSLGLSPGRHHCVVFIGKTHSASLPQQYKLAAMNIYYWGSLMSKILESNLQ